MVKWLREMEGMKRKIVVVVIFGGAAVVCEVLRGWLVLGEEAAV